MQPFHNLSLDYHTFFVVHQDMILKKNYRNVNQLPTFDSIVLNTGTKAVLEDKKRLIPNLLSMELLTGQKAQQIQAKVAVASFHLQKGNWIGWKTSLRNYKMSSFLIILINKVLPSLEFFSGITGSNIDSSGNIQFGIENLLLFNELDFHFESFEYVQGMNVTIKTTSKATSESRLFVSGYQIPFIR